MYDPKTIINLSQLIWIRTARSNSTERRNGAPPCLQQRAWGKCKSSIIVHIYLMQHHHHRWWSRLSGAHVYDVKAVVGRRWAWGSRWLLVITKKIDTSFLIFSIYKYWMRDDFNDAVDYIRSDYWFNDMLESVCSKTAMTSTWRNSIDTVTNKNTIFL